MGNRGSGRHWSIDGPQLTLFGTVTIRPHFTLGTPAMHELETALQRTRGTASYLVIATEVIQQLWCEGVISGASFIKSSETDHHVIINLPLNGRSYRTHIQAGRISARRLVIFNNRHQPIGTA